MTAEMAQAVADNQVWRAKRHIITGYLIKNLCRNLYLRSLIFNYYEGSGVRTVPDDSVASPLQSVKVDSFFVCHQRGRIAEVIYKEVNEMLPYPFLRSQDHGLSAQGVEDKGIAVSVCGKAKLSRRQIKRNHAVFFGIRRHFL